MRRRSNWKIDLTMSTLPSSIRNHSLWRSTASLVVCCLLACGCYGPSAPQGGSSVEAVLPFEIEHSTADGYVGWKACRSCHDQRVEEFQRTRHFLACRLPEDVEFPRGFRSGENSFLPPRSSARFEMSQDPQAAVTVFPNPKSAENKTISPIAFIYGSGAGTDEVYFTRRGNHLFELPVVWLSQQNCWGSSLINPYSAGDQSRPLSPQCLECHTIWVDYRRGSLNEYGPFDHQLLGVTCERCHGPAKGHVAHHLAHPEDRIAADIVQPKQLSRERLMDLCAQCHTNTVRHRRPPFSYRPGEDLEQSFHVLEMKSPELDRVANQVRYLKESRCYQQSANLTCVTCHNPHRSRNSEEPQSAHRSCATCHQPDNCGARTRLPDAVRDQCATCHMPKRNKVQVHFETATGEIVFPAPRYEHRIAIYPDAEWELLHEWYGTQADDESRRRQEQLGQELHVHWKEVGDAARDQHRFVVAIDAYRRAQRFSDSSAVRAAVSDVEERNRQSTVYWFEGSHQKQERRLDEAIATFESLLNIQPELARAHYELGTLYAAVNRRPLAISHLELARQHDGNDPGPEVMLGWLDYLDGNSSEALKHYRAAQAIEPWSERIEHMIGQCLMKLSRWDEAAETFVRALTIDPHHAESVASLRGILRERLSPEIALPLAIAAVKTTSGQDAGLLLTLGEIYGDAGQIRDSRQTLEVARKIAKEHASNLRPQIEKAIKEIPQR